MRCKICDEDIGPSDIDKGIVIPTPPKSFVLMVRIGKTVHKFRNQKRVRDAAPVASPSTSPEPSAPATITDKMPVEPEVETPVPVPPVATPPADIQTAEPEIDAMARRLRTGWLHEN